jgi:photosystem II stability/assembly factor-like uncharacterized protein
VATGQDDQARPVVAATTDGGAHWTARYGSTGGNALSCPSTSLCVSGGSTNPYSPPGESLLVDRSTDGSATWQQVLEYPDPPVTPIEDAIYSLSCPSTSNCLAFGYTGEFGIDNNQPPPPVPVAYSTADGGATWASRPLSTDFQASGPFKVDCPRVVDCYTIGQTAARLPTIEESTNSGWVWHAETVPSGVTSLTAIACPTYFRCYAVGGTSNLNTTPVAIIGTTDSGHTWKIQTTP